MSLSTRTLVLALLLPGCAARTSPSDQWYKGNLHTHSLWSDGADYPELIAAWYRAHGYNFLAVTEHDMLQTGAERWLDITAPDPGWPPRNASARAALPGYLERFGSSWVQQRENGRLVRLRPLNEYRHLFEVPDTFMFIMGEEITDKGGAHVNAFNLTTAVLPRGGATSADRIRNNIEAVAEQQAQSKQPMLTIVNHPNYVWALTPEDLAGIPAARHFEVYSGHELTNNAGDSVHPSTEKMWDIILTSRHRLRQPPIYGVATDDTHEYRPYHKMTARPGRGWVMVRAPRLTANALIAAMVAGDFYASTGVTLTHLAVNDDRMSLRIQGETGVTYRTQFIGSRIDGNAVGEVLSEVEGQTAQYRFRGDERYVRAKIMSSEPHIDPTTGTRLGTQAAWIQPVMR